MVASGVNSRAILINWKRPGNQTIIGRDHCRSARFIVQRVGIVPAVPELEF